MTDTVTIRPYQAEDLEPVLDLMRLALGETPVLQRTPALFAWKHIENPFGPSIMLIAKAAGTVAGFRAFMRWELTTPTGRTVKCVRAVDTATHPEYQRRGIFRRLTLDAIEVAKADGVELVFNTPNSTLRCRLLHDGLDRSGWHWRDDSTFVTDAEPSSFHIKSSRSGRLHRATDASHRSQPSTQNGSRAANQPPDRLSRLALSAASHCSVFGRLVKPITRQSSDRTYGTGDGRLSSQTSSAPIPGEPSLWQHGSAVPTISWRPSLTAHPNGEPSFDRV